MHRVRRSSRALAALCLIGVLATRAGALHQESPPAVRITYNAPHTHPSGRQWSTNAIAFTSPSDLIGNGNATQQVFVFSLLAYDCNTFTTRPNTPCPKPPEPSIRQLTYGTAAPANPSLTFNDNVKIAAFDAAGSFLGDTGPAAAHRQIFVMNLLTDEIQQITHGGDGDSIKPSLNRTGSVVTFESTASLLGPSNGVSQIYAFKWRPDQRVNLMLKLTNGLAPSIGPMPNKSGDQVAFETSSNLLGNGADTGTSQIFVASIDWVAERIITSQLTSGNASSHHPYLADNQNFVVFDSMATNFPNTAPGPGSRIFVAPSRQGTAPQIKQLTTYVPYGNCSFPALGAEGDRVAFICDGDPLGNGTTGNRAFVLAILPGSEPGSLFQITGRGDVPGPLSLHLGRNLLTLTDTLDLTGAGVCDYQLQLVDFFRDDKNAEEFWHAGRVRGELPQDMSPDFAPFSNRLGNHTVEFASGTLLGGSQATLTTATASTTVPLDTTDGQVRLEIGPPNVLGEAALVASVDRFRTIFPPVVVPGLGALCITPTEAGPGAIDCDGGLVDGDIAVQQFHGDDPGNPQCRNGCYELSKPEGALAEVPVCSFAGPHPELCRGPIDDLRSGAFTAGELQFTLKAKVALSRAANFDGWCNANDDYLFRDSPIELHFTTGPMTGTVLNANPPHVCILGDPAKIGLACIRDRDCEGPVPLIENGKCGTGTGGTLTSTLTGAPFDCRRLKQGDFTGAELVSAVPLLDVPNVNGLLQDALLTIRFAAAPPNVISGNCNPSICDQDVQCDDGDPCNGPETCSLRVCVNGPLPCDDADVCNGVETCVDNAGTPVCSPGTAPNCDDGLSCTADSCDATLGCLNQNLCTDGDPCNGLEICQAGGTCAPGTPPTCDDINACTDDLCVNPLGCTHFYNTDPCNDFDLCTQNDGCSAGACVGQPVPCSDGDACNGVEICVPTTGLCQGGVAPDCDDLNPCTDDTCDIFVGCLHTPNNAPCDDGDACTSGDSCDAGICGGAPNACDDGNACNGLETCDTLNGTCLPALPPSCDDGDECTVDVCVAPSGCTHTSVPGYPTCVLTQLYLQLGGIVAQLNSASTSAVGGNARRQKLLKLALGAQANVQAAANSTGTQMIKRSLRRAKRRMSIFTHLVNRGLSSSRMDQTFANTLLAEMGDLTEKLDIATSLIF